MGAGRSAGTGYNYHALLWSSTAASVVDLNPSGFTVSYAHGTSGNQQVGMGYGPGTGSQYHALLWSGTADSAVDLQKFLSSDYNSSQAWGIDANGNIIGYAYNIRKGQGEAILWVAVPEPATALLVAVAVLVMLRFHNRQESAP